MSDDYATYEVTVRDEDGYRSTVRVYARSDSEARGRAEEQLGGWAQRVRKVT